MRVRTLWDLLKATTVEWWNDNTFRLSASLAFYTIFSLAPLVVIAVAITGALYAGDAERYLVAQASDLIGEEGGRAVAEVAEAARSRRGGTLATVVGVALLLVGATVVFAELQSALNEIWDVRVKDDRGLVQQLVSVRLRSFGIAVAVGFLLLVSLVVSAVLAGVQEHLAGPIEQAGWLWRVVNAVVSFLLTAALFALVYKVLPDARITWRDVAIGALVTAALFGVGRYLIGIYLGQAAVGSAYGVAGSFAVLLIWIYYSALICFFGAEFTQVYARRFGSRIRPKTYAERVGRKSDTV